MWANWSTGRMRRLEFRKSAAEYSAEIEFYPILTRAAEYSAEIWLLFFVAKLEVDYHLALTEIPRFRTFQITQFCGLSHNMFCQHGDSSWKIHVSQQLHVSPLNTIYLTFHLSQSHEVDSRHVWEGLSFEKEWHNLIKKQRFHEEHSQTTNQRSERDWCEGAPRSERRERHDIVTVSSEHKLCELQNIIYEWWLFLRL